MQIKTGNAMILQRKQIGLNFLGDGDLVLQPLLLLLFFEQPFQRSCHGVERSAQFGKLIAAGDADAIVEIAAIDVLRRLVKIGDRRRDGLAQPERHPDGQYAEDRKEETEQDESDTQHAGDDSAERRTKELVVER